MGHKLFMRQPKWGDGWPQSNISAIAVQSTQSAGEPTDGVHLSQLVVCMPLASAGQLGLQHLALRRDAFGKPRQRVGEAFALVLDVDHPNTIAWEVLRFSLSVPFATRLAEPRRRGLLAP